MFIYSKMNLYIKSLKPLHIENEFNTNNQLHTSKGSTRSMKTEFGKPSDARTNRNMLF